MFFGRWPDFRQFFQFSIIGAVNTLIDFSIYALLTRQVHWFSQYYLAANAISFFCAVSMSYFLNSSITFRQDIDWLKYFKFVSVNLFTLMIIEVVLYWLVEHLSVFDLYAKILILLLSAVSNFILSKRLVFKKPL